jgi:hypothetical protein
VSIGISLEETELGRQIPKLSLQGDRIGLQSALDGVPAQVGKTPGLRAWFPG